MIPLLLEMDRPTVERELILPKLNFIFKKIGVINNVGITHYYKYISSAFELYILRDIDELKSKRARPSELHHGQLYPDACFALHTLNFGRPLDDIFETMDMLRLNLETQGKDRVAFKDLNYRSPIIKNLAEGNSSFSLANLKKMWEAKKELEARYKNTVQELDDLFSA